MHVPVYFAADVPHCSGMHPGSTYCLWFAPRHTVELAYTHNLTSWLQPHGHSCNDAEQACRYDPYGRVLTKEEYDQQGMRDVRRAAIEKAQQCTAWGLVLGTLGRQGNPALLKKIQRLLEEKRLKYTLVLLSEVTPDKLAMMPDIEAWVQIACPRCASFGCVAGWVVAVLSRAVSCTASRQAAACSCYQRCACSSSLCSAGCQSIGAKVSASQR
jgi:Putative diphthamide synthesis protein